MLLRRQNPIARSAEAWWPGGRVTTNAASPSPARTASIAASPAPDRATGGGHRAGRHHRVHVDAPAAGLGEALQRPDVVQVVHERELGVGGRARRHRGERVLQAGGIEPAERRGQTGRALGVVGTGVVLVDALGGGEEHAPRPSGRRHVR